MKAVMLKEKPNSIAQDAHLIDPNLLADSYVKQYLDNVNALTLTRPDFIPFLGKYIKSHPFFTPNQTLLNFMTLEQLE